MIRGLINFWRNRQTRNRFREIEKQTRASTKLTPRYERRRVHEITRALSRFPETSARIRLQKSGLKRGETR